MPLTSVVCRILEGIISDKLMDYLIVIINCKKEAGFCKKESLRNTNLLETMDFFSNHLADGDSFYFIFILSEGFLYGSSSSFTLKDTILRYFWNTFGMVHVIFKLKNNVLY